jgi:hypothetical protein
MAGAQTHESIKVKAIQKFAHTGNAEDNQELSRMAP